MRKHLPLQSWGALDILNFLKFSRVNSPKTKVFWQQMNRAAAVENLATLDTGSSKRRHGGWA
ncbi:MAG: hypothetical protein P0119_08255 [Nitrospira sp.]|nr:hypothetical protein [Nitrospira sp.]